MIALVAGMLAPAIGVIRADKRILDLEKDAGKNQPAVPRDRLLQSRHRFPALTRDEVLRAFGTAHALSEIVYAGDGYWDCPGEFTNTLRYTSNRVIGYISGCRATGEDTYKRRAIEGMEYILKHQSADGDFPWFYRSYRGVYNRADGLFEAGIAGRMFVEGFRLTGDAKWLDAAGLTASWEIDCPISANNNYNMFAVWHLAAHYGLTGDSDMLDAAVEKTRLGGMPQQLESGGWPEHNSWMWYHGIIVRGMAELYRVLPDDHPFKPELRQSLIAALNRAIREQTATGEIPPNPKVKNRGHTCPFILHGMLTARPAFGAALDTCIDGAMRYRFRKAPDEAFIEAYADAWKQYVAARRSARAEATGELMWRADLSRFVRDVEWGEVAPGASNCWYPCNDFVPGRQRWVKSKSTRTGGNAQEIVSQGVRLFGGMGWIIPSGTLLPGRRYRFAASVRCTGGPEKIPLVMCSAYAGKKHEEWDPFTDAEFTRENPTFDGFSEVSVPFTASAETNCVYVWTMGAELTEGECASLIVDEATITDAGLPLPNWDRAYDDFDTQTDMLLIPPGLYLEQVLGLG